MTRAKERLIVSGAIDREKKADANTPIGWVLGRLDLTDELDADGPVEVDRTSARFVLAVDRFRPAPPLLHGALHVRAVLVQVLRRVRRRHARAAP
jgi:ATP-dependent exoDNAse (exonuclease V) beta subunit